MTCPQYIQGAAIFLGLRCIFRPPSQNNILSALCVAASYLQHSGPTAVLSLWSWVSEVIHPISSSLSAGVASLKVPLVRSKVYNRAPEQSEQLETLTYQSAVAAMVESCSQWDQPRQCRAAEHGVHRRTVTTWIFVKKGMKVWPGLK
jgi:hypothetical protein